MRQAIQPEDESQGIMTRMFQKGFHVFSTKEFLEMPGSSIDSGSKYTVG